MRGLSVSRTETNTVPSRGSREREVYTASPVRIVDETRKPFRRRLDEPISDMPLLEELRQDHANGGVRDALRRALVETLLYGNRAELIRSLDETLLGLRPRPATALAA